MMDRVFSVEFQPLTLRDDSFAADGSYTMGTIPTDYRPIRIQGQPNVYWFSEHKLDLSGYAMHDLTVYFRNSFEQRGGHTSQQWRVDAPQDPLTSFDANFIETTILSSVPMSEANLLAAVLTAPGFIPTHAPTLDYGNFDRTHIIHGTSLLWGIDSTFGADVFTADGAAYNRVIQANDFSSLEPTAADCIYCYRVVYLSQSYTPQARNGLTFVALPAKRVILNATTEQEPDLEYLMRLKRSYELANQV